MIVKNQFINKILNAVNNCLKSSGQKYKVAAELNEKQLENFKFKIERIKRIYLIFIENYNTSKEFGWTHRQAIKEIENEIFGKSGYLKKMLDEFRKVPSNRKQEFGNYLNEFKNDVQQKLDELKSKNYE